MTDNRTIVATLSLAAIALLHLSSSAQAENSPASLWAHNGSTVDLYDGNDRRIFRYVTPRLEMQREGVITGTMLFSGARSGNAYRGTAYVFSTRCGAIPYVVTGDVSSDERHITMAGEAPTSLSDTCQPRSYRHDLLTFDLLRVYVAPPAVLDTPMASALADVTVTTPSLAAASNPGNVLSDVEGDAQRTQLMERAAEDSQPQHLATQTAIAPEGSAPSLATNAVTTSDREAQSNPLSNLAPHDPKTQIATPSSLAATLSAGQVVLIAVGALAIAIVVIFSAVARLSNQSATASADRAACPEPRTQKLADALHRPTDPSPPASPLPVVQPEPMSVVINRDTPAALAAMQLANAFIDELWASKLPDLDDEDSRRQQLNTLSLVARQIAIAERADPDAVFEDVDEHGDPLRLTLNQLKANTLYREGLTHRYYDKRKSLKALERATELSPHSPHMFHMLGLVHILNCNRAPAIAAFERAVALDPEDMHNRKELFRAQTMTDSEIFTYKVTRTAEKTIETGIRAWNIFAITYNIVTLPIRIPLKIGNWVLRVTRAI